MTRFSFRWVFRIRRIESPFENHGPLFTQWLPNGAVDAIEQPLERQSGTFRVWFERLGFVQDDGFIRFDYKRREVDASTVLRQGILDAGPIFGEVSLAADISETLRSKITMQVPNDDDVVSFAKPLVKEINEKLILVVDVLKYRYGQYWLPPVDVWDSRDYPLGVYCKYHLQLRLLSESGGNPVEVVPDNKPQEVTFTSIIRERFPEYLSQADWTNIRANVTELGKDLLLDKLLVESYVHFLDSDYQSAVVSACTAIELAIERFFAYETVPEPLKNTIAPIQALPLRAQIMTVLLASGSIGKAGMLIYFVDLRNKIVHEAFLLRGTFEYSFKELIETIGKIFLKRDIRLPNGNHGNILFPKA